MKNILTICLCAGLLAGTTGCSDFLDESPKSDATFEQYYQTPGQIEKAVNYLYRNGAPTFDTGNGAYYGTHGMLGGFLTGYFDNKQYAGQEYIIGQSLTLSRKANLVSGKLDEIWDDAYKAINNANAVITYGPKVQGVSETLLGEAAFFRAYNYFYLVKMFGDIPLHVTPYTSSSEDMFWKRDETTKVYAQIVTDLKDAVAKLPEGAFYDKANRVTKNVANTLLAEVYLQMSGYPLNEDHYADAAAAAKAVITSGSHSLTQNEDLKMNSAYNKLRTIDKLPEVIYAYEWDAAIASGGYRAAWSFPNSYSAKFKLDIANNTYELVNGIENMYNDSEDLRHQPNQFFHWEYTFSGDKTPTKLGATCNWYFYEEEAMLKTGKSTKNANIFRYPEVLLIAAEGIAKSSGVTAEAANYLAQVKARASLTGKTVEAYQKEVSALSKDDFIKEVWVERLREFPLEFKIWDDITRTRLFPVFSATNKGQVTFVNVVGAKNGNGATFKESDLLWPISVNEMQRNPNLAQNPGY